MATDLARLRVLLIARIHRILTAPALASVLLPARRLRQQFPAALALLVAVLLERLATLGLDRRMLFHRDSALDLISLGVM